MFAPLELPSHFPPHRATFEATHCPPHPGDPTHPRHPPTPRDPQSPSSPGRWTAGGAHGKWKQHVRKSTQTVVRLGAALPSPQRGASPGAVPRQAVRCHTDRNLHGEMGEMLEVGTGHPLAITSNGDSMGCRASSGLCGVGGTTQWWSCWRLQLLEICCHHPPGGMRSLSSLTGE